jgi:hypothetical protein
MPPASRARTRRLALALAFVLWPHADARATQKFGPLQLSGNLQSQNLIRHPDPHTLAFVQNRNVARLRFEYKWLESGTFYGKYPIPFLERSTLFLLYRGVYDSIYDLTPGFIEKEDIHGRSYAGKTLFEFARQAEDADRRDKLARARRSEAEGDFATARRLRRQAAGIRGQARRQLTLGGLSQEERDAYKFESTLREAYIDLKFRQIPLSVRAGKQQIVWGETDNFPMLDRVNSLDLTWHFHQELPAPAFGWDEIRRPFWMFKFLYDLGDVWKLSQSFLEWYWNPGDWYPTKHAFLPRPWGLRFLDPLSNPYDGAYAVGPCAAEGVHCVRLMNGTKLFQQGDYSRNPIENSQFGIRYHGITPQSVEFTLNYFYQRWAGGDGTNSAPLRLLPRNAITRASNQLVPRGIFPGEFIAPYVHTIGASANYSEERWTQAVFRFETVYDIGIPFFDVAKATVIDDPAIPGVTKKNMWKGMLAFDRPTWIKPLNRKTTFFFTGQLFWHYLVNNPSCDAQAVAQVVPDARGFRGTRSCLVGALDIPSGVRNGSANLGTEALRDKIRDWEMLFTLAGFTFYRGGSIVPVAGIAVDPVNQFSMEPFWMVDYVVRDDLVVNLTQRYFVTPRGHHTPIFETWGLAGMNAGRSETSLRFTYQF